MDEQRFDDLARSLAARPSRRELVRGGGGGGALAALVGIGATALGLGRGRAYAADHNACLLNVVYTFATGPEAGTRIKGTLAIPFRADGTVQDGTLAIKDGQTFGASGRVNGRALDLQIVVQAGARVAMAGAAQLALAECHGAAAGTFAGPQPGVTGTWRTAGIKRATAATATGGAAGSSGSGSGTSSTNGTNGTDGDGGANGNGTNADGTTNGNGNGGTNDGANTGGGFGNGGKSTDDTNGNSNGNSGTDNTDNTNGNTDGTTNNRGGFGGGKSTTDTANGDNGTNNGNGTGGNGTNGAAAVAVTAAKSNASCRSGLACGSSCCDLVDPPAGTNCPAGGCVVCTGADVCGCVFTCTQGGQTNASTFPEVCFANASRSALSAFCAGGPQSPDFTPATLPGQSGGGTDGNGASGNGGTDGDGNGNGSGTDGQASTNGMDATSGKATGTDTNGQTNGGSTQGQDAANAGPFPTAATPTADCPSGLACGGTCCDHVGPPDAVSCPGGECAVCTAAGVCGCLFTCADNVQSSPRVVLGDIAICVSDRLRAQFPAYCDGGELPDGFTPVPGDTTQGGTNGNGSGNGGTTTGDGANTGNGANTGANGGAATCASGVVCGGVCCEDFPENDSEYKTIKVSCDHNGDKEYCDWWYQCHIYTDPFHFDNYKPPSVMLPKLKADNWCKSHRDSSNRWGTTTPTTKADVSTCATGRVCGQNCCTAPAIDPAKGSTVVTMCGGDGTCLCSYTCPPATGKRSDCGVMTVLARCADGVPTDLDSRCASFCVTNGMGATGNGSFGKSSPTETTPGKPNDEGKFGNADTGDLGKGKANGNGFGQSGGDGTGTNADGGNANGANTTANTDTTGNGKVDTGDCDPNDPTKHLCNDGRCLTCDTSPDANNCIANTAVLDECRCASNPCDGGGGGGTSCADQGFPACPDGSTTNSDCTCTPVGGGGGQPTCADQGLEDCQGGCVQPCQAGTQRNAGTCGCDPTDGGGGGGGTCTPDGVTTHQCFDGSCLACDTTPDANGCVSNEPVLDDCRCASNPCSGGEGGGGGGSAPFDCGPIPDGGACSDTGCQECGGQCWGLCNGGSLDPATCLCSG